MLGVSRSGFPAWRRRPPSERALTDAWLLEKISKIHERSRGTYGSPRVHAELRRQGISVGKKRAERLMRQARLAGDHKRRKGKTTIRVEGVRVASDLVERDFNPSAPNRLLCADIKEIPTREGKLYLASVRDCFSRKVVGWSMRDEHAGRARRRRARDGADPPAGRGPASFITRIRARSTSLSCSAIDCAAPGSRSRWGRRATAATAPRSRATTPRSTRTCSAAAPSAPSRRRGR